MTKIVALIEGAWLECSKTEPVMGDMPFLAKS